MRSGVSESQAGGASQESESIRGNSAQVVAGDSHAGKESAGGGDAGFAVGLESVIASCHDDVRVGAEPSVALPPVA